MRVRPHTRTQPTDEASTTKVNRNERQQRGHADMLHTLKNDRTFVNNANCPVEKAPQLAMSGTTPRLLNSLRTLADAAARD
uniref:hypothetical protein n=1 Tax=Cupriavidus taiwanensis TaxID=164546 RepID=UPI003F496F9E